MMMVMLITAPSDRNLGMVLVIMTGTSKEARPVIARGPEMEKRKRMSTEALGAVGIGREIGTEMMRKSMEGKETETGTVKEKGKTAGVRVKGKGRKRAHGEAEVDLKGIEVILMTETERGAVTGTIGIEKGAGIRITETEKGRGNQGNEIERAGILMHLILYFLAAALNFVKILIFGDD